MSPRYVVERCLREPKQWTGRPIAADIRRKRLTAAYLFVAEQMGQRIVAGDDTIKSGAMVLKSVA
jgi:hypothetical protein